MRLATGCQDGLLRIYSTCRPAEAPLELKVSSSQVDGVSKIAWSKVEPDVVFVGKKSGVVEKWDTRVNATAAPVASVALPGGENIMDFEQSSRHNVLIVASGKKVSGVVNCTLERVDVAPYEKYILVDASFSHVLQWFYHHHHLVICKLVRIRQLHTTLHSPTFNTTFQHHRCARTR